MEDDVVVAPGKPLAQSLLWKSLSLRSMEYQAQEDKMLIQAEAALFVIYEAGQEQLPMQWMERRSHLQENCRLLDAVMR